MDFFLYSCSLFDAVVRHLWVRLRNKSLFVPMVVHQLIFDRIPCRQKPLFNWMKMDWFWSVFFPKQDFTVLTADEEHWNRSIGTAYLLTKNDLGIFFSPLSIYLYIYMYVCSPLSICIHIERREKLPKSLYICMFSLLSLYVYILWGPAKMPPVLFERIFLCNINCVLFYVYYCMISWCISSDIMDVFLCH